MAETYEGIVRDFDRQTGVGHISGHDGGEVLVTMRALIGPHGRFADIKEGHRVRYRLVNSPVGPMADHVEIVEGTT